MLWCCHDFVARAYVHQQSANGVLIRSWSFVLITVSLVFCAPFYNWWSQRHIWRNILLNLFLVTGELGTFCHRSCPPSLDLSNPIMLQVFSFCPKVSKESINPFPTHQLKERKHWHWDGETGKIQEAQLGIEPTASGFVHQRSDHWAITPQPLTTLNIPLLHL